jgi:hypothetical protein
MGGSLLGEMGYEPITNRCGHPEKIFSPRELVIGLWQELQLF